MTRLFADTNVVLDLLGKREPFANEAAELFSLADKGKVQLTVSALTIANTHYVLSKLKTAKEARKILRNFKVLITVAPLEDKILELSLNDEKFADFEDGIQYYTALESNQEILISRNLRDFKHSAIPVMTAGDYLKI